MLTPPSLTATVSDRLQGEGGVQSGCGPAMDGDDYCPVLKIEFGPPHTDFGSVWSPQKARKYRHFVTVSIYHTKFSVQIQFCCPLRGAYN